MMHFIDTGTVIANELIALTEKTGIRQISATQHLEYEKYLRKCAMDKFNFYFVILPHYEGGLTEWVQEERNARFFQLAVNDNELFIKLKDNVSTNDVRKRYRVMLSLEELKVFMETEKHLLNIVSNKQEDYSI